MVDVAQDTLLSQHFRPVNDTYVHIADDKESVHSEVERCSTLNQQNLGETVGNFLYAYPQTSSSSEPSVLVQLLVALTRDTMQAAHTKGKSKLLLDIKDILDSEPFLCGICLLTTQEPTTIYCGHTFCRKCVDKHCLDTCIACGKNPEVPSGFQPNVLIAGIMLKLFPKLEELTKLKKQANLQFVNKDYAEAIKLYTTLIECSKDDHTAWGNRSYAHTKLGNNAEALKDAIMATQLKPHWAKGYFRRGTAEELLGRSEEAALSYMKCLAIDKEAHQANTNLTQIIGNLLEPNTMAESSKPSSSATNSPLFHLLSTENFSNLKNVNQLSKIVALLDKQFEDCDTVLHIEAEISKVDPAVLTPDMFDCSLCCRLLHDPVTTPCGHVFCHHCLDRSMDHNSCCPQCRGSLQEHQANRHKSVTISIQRMLTFWFPKQVADRRKLHEEDLATFSTEGNSAEIPIFACTMAFPTIPCPLHIFEPQYRLMIRQVMESGVRQFGMCLSTGGSSDAYADHGTMLEINDLKLFEDGRSVVDTVGCRRFQVLSRSVRDGYNVAKVQFIDDPKLQGESLAEIEEINDRLYGKVTKWFSSLPKRIAKRLREQFGDFPEKGADVQVRLGPKWVWWVTAILPVDPRAQLAILKMSCLKDRLLTIDRVISFLQNRE